MSPNKKALRLYVPCPGISLDLDLDYQSIGSGSEGVLGTGWSHTYEWSLSESSTNVAVYSGSGEMYAFEKIGESTYAPCEFNNWIIEEESGGYLLSMPGGLEYHFNSNGRLLRINDGWNNGVGLSYNVNGLPEHIIHDNGNQIDLSYIAYSNEWRLHTAEVNDGPSITFSYNANGLFTQIVEQVENISYVSTYDYCDGYLTNRNNGTFDYCYDYETDQNGYLTGKGTYLSADSGHYEHTVTYTDDNTSDVAYSTRGESQYYRYLFDNSGLSTYTFGPGESIQDVYDRGIQYSYLGSDLIEEMLFDDEIDELFRTYKQYDSFHNVTNVSVGYCTSERIPVSSATYDDDGLLPVVLANAEGERIETVYTNGVPSRIKAFYSETESYDMAYEYYADGLLKSVTNANGHVTSYTYDSNGYPATSYAELGPIVSDTYNGLGFVTQAEILVEGGLSSGRITLFVNDTKGRVERIDYADGTYETYQYNALDYLTNSVDRAGRSTDYVYGPSRKLLSTSRYLEQNGEDIPVTISYDFDEQFNTLRITEPSERYVESYKLDIQDRVTEVTNIEDQVMIIDYGLGDFVKKVTRFDGTSITNAYDAAGRKKVDAYLNASDQLLETVNYQYYLDGELKSVSDSTSTIANGYDHLNQLTATTSSVASVVSVADYQYDPVGNLTNSAISVGSSQVAEAEYEYDEAERLEEITSSDSGVFEYDYNPTNGYVAEISNSVSGITTSYSYDIMDRVTNITYSASNGSLIRSIGYDYNAVGMITNKTILGGSNPQALSYRYDSLDRLTEESSDSWSHRLKYEYDLAGNMTNLFYMEGSCEPSCYDADKNNYCDYCSHYCLDYESTFGAGNRLTSWWGENGGSALYGLAGNTTNMDQSSSVEMNLEWDEHYRLIHADSSVFSISYDYDASGRRVSHTYSGFATYFIYDGYHVVADVDSSGNILRSYTYGLGIDNILSMTVHETSGTSTYYYLKDHQNSVIALTDESGSVVESYEYSAWGQVLYVRNSVGTSIGVSAYGNRYLFQGREYDWNTKLYYFRARWYCPESGRWISKDPIGISGGQNLYIFCENNSINFTDWSGYCPERGSGYYAKQWSRPWWAERYRELVELVNTVDQLPISKIPVVGNTISTIADNWAFAFAQGEIIGSDLSPGQFISATGLNIANRAMGELNNKGGVVVDALSTLVEIAMGMTAEGITTGGESFNAWSDLFDGE